VPQPISPRRRYAPGLDGLRAIAVIVVVGYHLGVAHLSGGLLGVGVFFTLSGFLITRVLSDGIDRDRDAGLRQFWTSRARRLLPALLVMLSVVLAATAAVDTASLTSRIRQSVAALFYIANWTTIAHGVSYFDRFSGPGPLDHLWSLSIEEQFYLVWPVLLAVLFGVRRWSLRRTAAMTTMAGLASFGLLALLAHPGFDDTRAYEGTDTRAGGILLGAALGLLWPLVEPHLTRSRIARTLIQAAGVAGLGGIGYLVVTTDEYSVSLYRGGLLLLTVCTLAVLVAVGDGGAPSHLGKALGVAPLRWIGERSYGIYLWHLPVVAFTPRLGAAARPWQRDLVLVALTLAIADLSWRLVEDPVRRLGLLGALRVAGRRFRIWRGQPLPRLVYGTAAVFVIGTTLLSACSLIADSSAEPVSALADAVPPTTSTSFVADAMPAHVAVPWSLALRAHAPTTAATPAALHTSCSADVHVGDSTSLGLVESSYLPQVSDQLPAQLHRVGVRSVTTDISGARSIVETYDGQPNATEAVTSRMDAGYSGCWTIAMGVNEAANQAVGGVYPFSERIDRLMQPIGNHPVLWLTVRTVLTQGPYANSGMQSFDRALVAACARYPDLRIYDWGAEVKSSWFIDDGIHYTTAGYRERARRIADALAIAFPADGPPSSSCVVHS
jgi:peptidoglycan/LPS O-acetylase OafA/YrhL